MPSQPDMLVHACTVCPFLHLRKLRNAHGKISLVFRRANCMLCGAEHRCGSTRNNAENTCVKCPSGRAKECPSGHSCFADMSICSAAAVASHSPPSQQTSTGGSAAADRQVQDSGGSKSNSKGGIIAAAVAVPITVLLALCAAVALFFRHRRRRSKGHTPAPTETLAADESAARCEAEAADRSLDAAQPSAVEQSRISRRAVRGSQFTPQATAASAARKQPVSQSSSDGQHLAVSSRNTGPSPAAASYGTGSASPGTYQASGTGTSTWTTSHASRQDPSTLSETGWPDQLVTALQNQALATPAQVFAGKYTLLDERVTAGQSVVNFARNANGGFHQYALKCAVCANTCTRLCMEYCIMRLCNDDPT